MSHKSSYTNVFWIDTSKSIRAYCEQKHNISFKCFNIVYAYVLLILVSSYSSINFNFRPKMQPSKVSFCILIRCLQRKKMSHKLWKRLPDAQIYSATLNWYMNKIEIKLSLLSCQHSNVSLNFFLFLLVKTLVVVFFQ